MVPFNNLKEKDMNKQMTVKELIEILKSCDQNLIICFETDECQCDFQREFIHIKDGQLVLSEFDEQGNYVIYPRNYVHGYMD
jgi:hypothetical protein